MAPPADGQDGSLSPSSGGAVDPVVAQLDKPLTRLPELTSPAAVASNPFGEAFKTSNPKLSVDDFELLKVVGKGSFVRCTANTQGNNRDRNTTREKRDNRSHRSLDAVICALCVLTSRCAGQSDARFAKQPEHRDERLYANAVASDLIPCCAAFVCACVQFARRTREKSSP